MKAILVIFVIFVIYIMGSKDPQKKVKNVKTNVNLIKENVKEDLKKDFKGTSKKELGEGFSSFTERMVKAFREGMEKGEQERIQRQKEMYDQTRHLYGGK